MEAGAESGGGGESVVLLAVPTLCKDPLLHILVHPDPSYGFLPS